MQRHDAAPLSRSPRQVTLNCFALLELSTTVRCKATYKGRMTSVHGFIRGRVIWMRQHCLLIGKPHTNPARNRELHRERQLAATAPLQLHFGGAFCSGGSSSPRRCGRGTIC